LIEIRAATIKITRERYLICGKIDFASKEPKLPTSTKIGIVPNQKVVMSIRALPIVS